MVINKLTGIFNCILFIDKCNFQAKLQFLTYYNIYYLYINQVLLSLSLKWTFMYKTSYSISCAWTEGPRFLIKWQALRVSI